MLLCICVSHSQRRSTHDHQTQSPNTPDTSILTTLAKVIRIANMPYCKEKADVLLCGMESEGPALSGWDFPALGIINAGDKNTCGLETRSDACIKKEDWVYTELIDLNGVSLSPFLSPGFLQLSYDGLGKLELEILGDHLESLNIGDGERSRKEGYRECSGGDDNTWSTEVRTDGSRVLKKSRRRRKLFVRQHY